MQRDLGWNLVGDFSYVGSKGRNLLQTRNINAVPYGTNFLAVEHRPDRPAGALPERVPAAVSRLPATSWSRSSPGSRTTTRFQMQISRRYTAGFRFSASYTYAMTKNVGIASPPNNNPTVNPFLPFEDRNYGDAGRRHNLAIDYSYQVPNLSSKWNSPIAKVIGDGWEISGVTSALSGAALALDLLARRASAT